MNYKELQEPIKISQGAVFKNFTGRYLLNQIKLLDDEFNSHFRKTQWLAFGLCDRKYEYYTEFDNKLFMIGMYTGDVQHWLNNYEHYLYQDGEANKLGVIIDLPINNRDDFLMGNYSQLYKNVDLLFKEFTERKGVKFPSSSYNVLTKKEIARKDFEARLNKDFGGDYTVTKDQEYEYPPIMNKEIFHYD